MTNIQENVNLTEKSVFKKSFSGKLIKGLNLNSCTFESSTLKGSHIGALVSCNTTIKRASIYGCCIQNFIFDNKTTIRESHLTDVKLYKNGAFLHSTFFSNIFNGVLFHNIDFKKTLFMKNAFIDCIFSNCLFENSIIKGSSFSGCLFYRNAFERQDKDYLKPYMISNNFMPFSVLGPFTKYRNSYENLSTKKVESNIRVGNAGLQLEDCHCTDKFVEMGVVPIGRFEIGFDFKKTLHHRMPEQTEMNTQPIRIIKPVKKPTIFMSEGL